jgi:23S rRNA (cytidine1920-2'-O)/16S rRNA (cytidine1409-2'-O)-methyltransferase
MVQAKKERLDRLVVERGLAPTRAKAQALIMAGEVRVNGETATKPGMTVPVTGDIELIATMPYASRGGYKLAGALQQFGLDVRGRVCVDVGACTGGFTDVLLQHGAARVYAIDVGYGQLDWKLRQDERVVVMERTNVRYQETMPEAIDFVCIDVSFISLQLIFPVVAKWLRPVADVVALIKPQFEAGRKQVGKGGIVKDAAVHRQVLQATITAAAKVGLHAHGLIRSPIEGAEGNVEFLAWLRRDPAAAFELETALQEVVPGYSPPPIGGPET